MPDLNAYDLDAAMKIVAGTAKNMGVKVGRNRCVSITWKDNPL